MPRHMLLRRDDKTALLIFVRDTLNLNTLKRTRREPDGRRKVLDDAAQQTPQDIANCSRPTALLAQSLAFHTVLNRDGNLPGTTAHFIPAHHAVARFCQQRKRCSQSRPHFTRFLGADDIIRANDRGHETLRCGKSGAIQDIRREFRADFARHLFP